MKFFVSYSRSVQEPVRAIITSLRDDGEEVWWDQDLRAGQDWWATILDSIEQCQVCLFFVSEKSVQSPYCMEELRYALARNRLVLPYVMDAIAYTLPPEIMKSRIQFETYEGTPEHIRERIRLTCGGVRWDQYKDRYAARPPEPNTGTSNLVDRLDKAISLANEGYFDEASAGFSDVANNDYDEYGVFCHEWIDKINRYKDLSNLANRPAMKQLAKPKWEKFVQQYGDEFDPLGVESKFLPSKKVIPLVQPEALAPATPNLTARDYFQRGEDFYKRGDYDRAIKDYTEAIQLNRQFLSAYLNRANCYFAQEDYARAIPDFSQVLKLDPQNVDAYRLRGLSYDIGKQDYDHALADYNEALRLNPQSHLMYLNRAIIYNRRSDHDRALADYTEALRLNPRYTIAYNNRAITYLTRGEYDKALEDCEKALSLSPKEAYIYDTRGDIYFAAGDYDRAIADYEMALAIDPNASTASENLKKAREARTRFATRASSPRTAEDYLEQGKSRAAHEHDLKIADYSAAIRLAPRMTEAYLRRAGNYNAKEDYDSALEDYDTALRLEPDNFIAFNGRGLIYASLMQHSRAIEDYTEAIQLAPQFADVYYNRGISHASIGSYDEAIVDYTEALRLEPRFANGYYNRGLSYHNTHDYDRAIADYDTALKLDPNHPYAAKNRQRAIEAKGR